MPLLIRHYRLLVLQCLFVGTAFAASTVAFAETHLSILGDGQVQEVAHRLQIEFGAESIEVKETMLLTNRDAEDAEAIYTFELPGRAAISSLVIEGASTSESQFGVVESEASTRLVASPQADSRSDLGLVRMIASEGSGPGDLKRYELRVFPVPGKKSIEVHVHWESPVDLIANHYSVRIPGRGEESGLARSEVSLATTSTMLDLFGGDKALTPRAPRNKRYRFFAPVDGDLVIQGRALKSQGAPQAEVALLPLSKSTGIAALRVVVPDSTRLSPPSFERVMIIVDVSRSLGDAGRQAASNVVDGLLADLGTGTQIEAILYDRKARRVLGELKPGELMARSAIVRAIRSAPDVNGSDLGAALTLAGQSLAQSGPGKADRTLVVVVSDGMLPTTLSGPAALDKLGLIGGQSPRVLAAVLVPPNAPLPDLRDGALGGLVHGSGGRISAFRHEEAATRGRKILGELAQSPPLEALEVELDRGDFVGANLPGSLMPGSSVMAFGYYEDGVPRRVVVRGYRGGTAQTMVARNLPRAEATRLARIVLATTSPDSYPGPADAEGSRGAMVRTAARLGVVTEVSAGIAIDKSDGFARARLSAAERWGAAYYRRLPPPPERGGHASFPQFTFSVAKRSQRSGRTGQLDKEAVERRIKAHVIPQARGCYDGLVRRDSRAGGALRLHIEIARGEVHHAAIPELALSLEPIRDCILDAMYAMPMPRVRQGADPEAMSIASYPLRFRLKRSGKAGIETRTPTTPSGDLDTNDPLSGLPE